MFLMVDLVHSACSDVTVARVQEGSTDVPGAESGIGTVLTNTLPLCLSKELLCKVDELFVRYSK